MNKQIYMIIPGCSDLNRGDQALVWETKRLAEESGFRGIFYLTAERKEPVTQSRNNDIRVLVPVLEHPSRRFRKKENISYGLGLIFCWGIVAMGDLLLSLLLLLPGIRKIGETFLSSEQRKTLQILEQSDAVFVKGGGLLQTYGGWTSTYAMYFWVYPILLAWSRNKKIYVMPNSFGPFQGPFVRKIAKWALKKCTLLTARETRSENVMKKELHLMPQVFPDLGFFLNKSELTKEKLCSTFELPENRKWVAITVRPYRFPNEEDPAGIYGRFIQEMSLFIRWLYQSGYMPVLVEHTLAVHSHEDDRACIQAIVQSLPREAYRLVSETAFDCRDLKAVYGYCDYLVGTRFHSVIFALSSGIPSLAITYAGNKAEGIMHDMGLDAYVTPMREVTCEVLKARFYKMKANEDDVREKIQNYLCYAERAREQLKEKLRKERGRREV